jgi:hypothetical protein
MGNSESVIENNSHEKNFYNIKYNWITSYPLIEYDLLNLDNLSKILPNYKNNLSQYIDLRVNSPPILDIRTIPIHPIASVCSMLNFQLIKCKLPIFPPSRLFIYHNCGYFPNVESLLSFDTIFKSIEKFGFCSEIDLEYSEDNLINTPTNLNYKVAEAFKFINIYRVDNSLEIIKILLQNEMPLLLGIVLYYDLKKIVDKMWLPDLSIDKRIGGITALLVGYIDERKDFILQFSYGKTFGLSGYVTIPYEYVLNKLFVPEIYYIDLNKNRIEGFINQRREVISLQDKINKKPKKKYDDVQTLFS